MKKVMTFTTGYNTLHIPIKHMTKFLDMLEDCQYGDDREMPGGAGWKERVLILAERPPETNLTDALPTMAREDYDLARDEIENRENAEASTEESDA